MNFFNVDGKLVFVDLPGYGFAKVPIEVREKWGPLIEHYLEKDNLKLILFLFDIRRLPNDDDKMFLDWVVKNQKSMILVLTKIDKVTANQKASQTRAILSALEAENIHYIYYSVPKNVGRKELITMMNEALEEERA